MCCLKNHYLYYIGAFLYGFVFHLLSASEKQDHEDPIVTITTHSVGEGNYIDISISRKDKSKEYIIIDAGSRNFNQRINYQETNENNNSTSLQGKTPEKGKTQEYKFQVEAFQDRQKNEYLLNKVSKVIITHPDWDHFGWISKILPGDKKCAEEIYLGGLPEQYDKYSSHKINFRDWLISQHNLGVKIYFPCLEECVDLQKDSFVSITKKKLKALVNKDSQVDYKYANQMTKLEKLSSSSLEMNFLSINPLHFKGINQFFRANSFSKSSAHIQDYEDLNNHDSLVIKISNGKYSCILTGDATGLTTDRILDNFSSTPETIKANVLIAAHHGSGTKGSNNLEWIKAVDPECIIISCGVGGHPHKNAFTNFWQAPHLAKTRKHSIFVAPSEEEIQNRKQDLKKQDLEYMNDILDYLEEDSKVTKNTDIRDKILFFYNQQQIKNNELPVTMRSILSNLVDQSVEKNTEKKVKEQLKKAFNKEIEDYKVYSLEKAIFSTLLDGSIIIDFFKEQVVISRKNINIIQASKAEKQKILTLSKLNTQKVLTKEEALPKGKNIKIDIDSAEKDEIIVSPTKGKGSNKEKNKAVPTPKSPIQEELQKTEKNLSNRNISLYTITDMSKDLKKNTILTYLNLSNNNIEDKSAIILAKSLKDNTTLQSLDVSKNQIRYLGAKDLMNLNLMTLNLSKNCKRPKEGGNNYDGKDIALTVAKALEVNTKLTSLDLSDNYILTDGLRALAEVLKDKNTTLKILNLENNISSYAKAKKAQELQLKSIAKTLKDRSSSN